MVSNTEKRIFQASENVYVIIIALHTVHAFAKANTPPSNKATFQGMRAVTVFQSNKGGISLTSSIGLSDKYLVKNQLVAETIC